MHNNLEGAVKLLFARILYQSKACPIFLTETCPKQAKKRVENLSRNLNVAKVHVSKGEAVL